MRGVLAAVVLMPLILPGCAPGQASEPPRVTAKQGPVLKRFASDRAFRAWLRKNLPKTESYSANGPVPLPAPPAVEAPTVSTPVVMADTANAAPANPEITNNQTVGVDEGGIVKQIGRYLVVLQDGRVFSVDLGRGSGAGLALADRIDVYRSPAKAASWYDEMLVQGDRILVTAYNYAEHASEMTVLRLSPEGKLSREGRFLISSDDYYSTDNYATRLVGDNLVLYAPYNLSWASEQFEWPRLRRADGDGEADKGAAMLGATQVYAPPGKMDEPVLHTVSVCPLKTGMQCRTTGFIGPAMREFYVSPTDAFVWIGAPDGLPWSIDYGNMERRCRDRQWRGPGSDAAMLYRLPLDGSAIGAVSVDGVPADQFAFDSKDGHFRALLTRADKGECVDYGAPGALALLDLPLSSFGATVREASGNAYTRLPALEVGMLENRFVGNWLIYGGREGWSGLEGDPDSKAPPRSSALYAVPLANPRAPMRIGMPHNAVRIERAGNDAVVTGYRDGKGLSVSYVRLGTSPALASTLLLGGRFESEGRSHAFNAWVRPDGSGMIGLPTTRREWRAGRGWSDSESSELSFIALDPARQLASAGELSPGARRANSGYTCQVSCIDWYGNSRPIFTGGRIFALMGTDLVEGTMRGGRMTEVARVDMTGRVR